MKNHGFPAFSLLCLPSKTRKYREIGEPYARRKIDLEGEKSPKVENFIFRLFNFHITQKKLLGTLRAPLSRTRDLVIFFGRKITVSCGDLSPGARSVVSTLDP